MRLKWVRKDGAWRLWRGFVSTDGATLWQETGYVVIRSQVKGMYFVKRADGFTYTRDFSLAMAKAEAERLAKEVQA